jgi:hypothetical protein
MPTFLIERDLPGAGALTPGELAAIAARSNEVLAAMGGRAVWLESFVTEDRITCVYEAEDVGAIEEHGRCGGFPVTTVHRVLARLDPDSAETAPAPA